MAERKSRGSSAGSERAASGSPTTTGGAKRRRKKQAEVIDVGERPADGENTGDEDQDQDDDGKPEVVEGADVDIASAAPIDADEVADDDAAAPEPATRGGSIA